MTQVIEGRQEILDGLERGIRGQAEVHVWQHRKFPNAVLKFAFVDEGAELDQSIADDLYAVYGENAYYSGQFSPLQALVHKNYMLNARGDE